MNAFETYLRRHAGWLDAALVAVLAVASIPWTLHDHRPHRVAMIAVAVLLPVPLLWRRRWPFETFLVMCGVAFVQWIFLLPVFSDAALLIGLFTISVRETRQRIIAAAVILEVGVILAVWKDARPNPNWLIALIMLSGLVVAAAATGRNVRMRAEQLREFEHRALRLEFERDQQAQLAAAAERTRIARELHDIVAHNLAVMISLIDGGRLGMDHNPDQARTALTEAGTVGRRAMADLRQVLGVLRGQQDDPERSPAPTIADLDSLVASARDTGLRISVRMHGDLHDLPDPLQLSVFRIVQESLTNVVKHAAGATAVTVDIAMTPTSVDIEVTDDGAPTSIEPHAVGHGLSGIRERAAMFHGTADAGAVATGWRVRARLTRPAQNVETPIHVSAGATHE